MNKQTGPPPKTSPHQRADAWSQCQHGCTLLEYVAYQQTEWNQSIAKTAAEVTAAGFPITKAVILKWKRNGHRT